MDKETIRKEIDYYINVKNNLWLAIITTIGGTLTLLFTFNGVLKLIFIIIGVIFTILLLNGYSKTDEHIKKLFKKLKTEDK